MPYERACFFCNKENLVVLGTLRYPPCLTVCYLLRQSRVPLVAESVEILSLELITLSVKSVEAETVRGVRVTVSGTCQVKVDAFTHDDLSQNLPQITLACQHFLGKVRLLSRWPDLFLPVDLSRSCGVGQGASFFLASPPAALRRWRSEKGKANTVDGSSTVHPLIESFHAREMPESVGALRRVHLR